ncbi:MAG: transposase [Gammaproteobacteria bacterium]
MGPRKTKGIRLAVMDMWKPFRNSTRKQGPQAAILFDTRDASSGRGAR